MNYTNYNGFKLPIMGAKVSDATPEEKQEYLRLLNKASGFNRDAFFCDYQGIPYCPEITENYFFSGECHAVNHFQTILPIQEAITWLKLATKEITADNFAVDVTKPDERLEDFKRWYVKKTKEEYRFTSKYYGFYAGKTFYFNELKESDRVWTSVPDLQNIITTTQFFAYLHEDERHEPKAGDMVECSDDNKDWRVTGEYIGLIRNGLYFVNLADFADLLHGWKHIRLPQPDPIELKRKEALNKAVEFCKSKGHDITHPILETLTQYIMDQEGKG